MENTLQSATPMVMFTCLTQLTAKKSGKNSRAVKFVQSDSTTTIRTCSSEAATTMFTFLPSTATTNGKPMFIHGRTASSQQHRTTNTLLRAATSDIYICLTRMETISGRTRHTAASDG